MENETTCRLCTRKDLLAHLYQKDGDTTLDEKIHYCLDIKINEDDGLPVMICKMCEMCVKNFYEFKLKCIQIDSKLRATKNLLSNKPDEETDFSTLKIDVKLESELFSKNDNDLKATLDSWLSDDADSNVYKDLFNRQAPVKLEPSPCILYETSKKHVKKTGEKNRNKHPCTNKIYQCEICGSILKNKSVLGKHIATHSGIKQFSCKLCPKTFTRAEHKVVHMRTHLGIKPFICEICGRSFTKRQDLIRHMRIHSDEKNYTCPRCDRRFKRSWDVQSHMRTHTGAKPFSCTECDKSYTSHSGLRKHYNMHCKRKSNITSDTLK